MYLGEWKDGVIYGRGVLIWANINKYDGIWENGIPKGNGVFTWVDRSCYIGNWNNEDLNGTFYPSVALGKRSSVDWKSYSNICIWESNGEAGDITCEIVDGLELCKDVEFGRGKNISCFRSREGKKFGQTISKGHKNYELMLNLQLGIRYSMGRAFKEMRELRNGDFDPKEKFWTRFPTEGSKTMPPHQSAEFRWKDYCPMVFRYLRKLFNVDPVDYMMAICGNDALRELSSPRKSGSFFYFTQDNRFMIKIVKKSKVKIETK